MHLSGAQFQVRRHGNFENDPLPATEYSYAPSPGDETHLQYDADPPFLCVCVCARMLPGYESLPFNITSTRAQAATTNGGEALLDSVEPIRGSPAQRSIMSPRHLHKCKCLS